MHLHNGPGRTYADVWFGGDFGPVTASTPKQRQALLEQVKAHVTAELASRQRNRGQAKGRTDRRILASVFHAKDDLGFLAWRTPRQVLPDAGEIPVSVFKFLLEHTDR